MYKLLLIALAAGAAQAGTASAQAYDAGPRPAYAAAGWYDGDGDCRGGRFTLAGAHAGVTVLGVDVGASAGLHVGLHDRCGGGRPIVYAPAPQAYSPPQGYDLPPPAYAQQGYGDVGYPGQAYAPPAYPSPSAYGYAYMAPAGYGYGYGYGRPCGC